MVTLAPFSFRVVSLGIDRDDQPLVDADTGERYRGVVHVRIRAIVIARDNGLDLPIAFSRRFPVHGRQTEADMVRELLIEALTHEVDECLLVDGKRVRDPHPPSTLKPQLKVPE